MAVFLNEDGSEIEKFTLRSEITNDITVALGNDADLRTVKNIYKNRPLKIKAIKDYWFSDSKTYYRSDVPLSQIFEDMRSDYFLKEKGRAKLKIESLNIIIDEYAQTNPFDSLEPNQKDLFKNIRLKSNENYPNIKLEIEKVVSELTEKNSLVNRYLKDSTLSFWVSIGALVFSLFIGVLQLIQSWQTSKKRAKIFEYITKHDKDA